MKDKDITIMDMARALGISCSTVSRALADHHSISKATKNLVIELAESVGYRPNFYAKNLRSGRTNTLGLIVPRIDSFFMSTVIAGIEDESSKEGYCVIIAQSSELQETEEKCVDMMYSARIDGLLVSASRNTTNTNHFDHFFKKNLPIVFFDRVLSGETYPCVSIDNKYAAYEATAHLIKTGHQKLLNINMDSKVNVYADRLAGFKAASEDNGIECNTHNILFTDLSYESGRYCAEKILAMSDKPDGLFIANDNCAVGCLEALKTSGLKVPEDIAIVGFNNDIIAQVASPSLTTIDYPGYTLGQVAAIELINKIKNIHEVPSRAPITLQSKLVIRNSS